MTCDRPKPSPFGLVKTDLTHPLKSFGYRMSGLRGFGRAPSAATGIRAARHISYSGFIYRIVTVTTVFAVPMYLSFALTLMRCFPELRVKLLES